MSKPSRRENREQIKAKIKEYKKAQRQLREDEKVKGFVAKSHATISNHTCVYESVEEESRARNEVICEQVRIFRAKLPVLLKRLSKIEDPRNAKKIKHKLPVLMLYGILSFVFQMSSCREANREMTRPMFWENLKFIFPEIEDLPHHDTIKRLLADIDVSQIEKTHIEMIREMIRKKKFRRYLINGCYPIAIDGTGNLQRTVKTKEGPEPQYHVYVLEANLAFCNGMSIPLMSEFLSYTDGDTGNDKQDCEIKAFYRLANRLKAAFPALKIMVLLDGLYAKGPVMELCRKNKWQYMIVLKDDALPTVMREFECFSGLEVKNRCKHTWGNRRQLFKWANNIEYFFGLDGKEIVHVVECKESWQEIDRKSMEPVEKRSRHVWLSSVPLTRWNLHDRCNLAARSRWCIESSILVEKHHGYKYEHCFSYNWNAMKGYHYLMRLGHMINVLACYSVNLSKIIRDTGVRGLIRFIRETMAHPWLDHAWLAKRLAAPFQLRLL
jgi:hypothetical protein